jgi:hypothetical protein
MKDPFPFESPNWLIELVTPICQRLGLYTLPYHIHEVIFAASFYYTIQTVVSPWLSPKLFPKHYPQHSARTRFNWDVHVVSFVQSVLVCAMALYEMAYDEERAQMDWQERVWGYTGGTGLIEAFGCGYFLWDLIVTAMNYSMYGFGTLAHAVSAITVFSFGFVSVPHTLSVEASVLNKESIETIRQLLRPRLRSLRALLPLPEHTLVL